LDLPKPTFFPPSLLITFHGGGLIFKGKSCTLLYYTDFGPFFGPFLDHPPSRGGTPPPPLFLTLLGGYPVKGPLKSHSQYERMPCWQKGSAKGVQGGGYPPTPPILTLFRPFWGYPPSPPVLDPRGTIQSFTALAQSLTTPSGHSFYIVCNSSLWTYGRSRALDRFYSPQLRVAWT